MFLSTNSQSQGPLSPDRQRASKAKEDEVQAGWSRRRAEGCGAWETRPSPPGGYGFIHKRCVPVRANLSGGGGVRASLAGGVHCVVLVVVACWMTMDDGGQTSEVCAGRGACILTLAAEQSNGFVGLTHACRSLVAKECVQLTGRLQARPIPGPLPGPPPSLGWLADRRPARQLPAGPPVLPVSPANLSQTLLPTYQLHFEILPLFGMPPLTRDVIKFGAFVVTNQVRPNAHAP